MKIENKYQNLQLKYKKLYFVSKTVECSVALAIIVFLVSLFVFEHSINSFILVLIIAIPGAISDLYARLFMKEAL